MICRSCGRDLQGSPADYCGCGGFTCSNHFASIERPYVEPQPRATLSVNGGFGLATLGDQFEAVAAIEEEEDAPGSAVRRAAFAAFDRLADRLRLPSWAYTLDESFPALNLTYHEEGDKYVPGTYRR
jgi:hypothetical protein